tara:strand:+ start:1276 stop:1758 length:483 start_codon:yes stop_codon:yes gene_type:complete
MVIHMAGGNKSRITTGVLMGLSDKHAMFVINYLMDFSPRRAAEASGYTDAEYGYQLLLRPEIEAVIDVVLRERMAACHIDSDWLLNEMIDNHKIARQQGNITASNTALSMVGKHKRIDAFAATVVNINTDADVVERLNSARRRVIDITPDKKDDDTVSFM